MVEWFGLEGILRDLKDHLLLTLEYSHTQNTKSQGTEICQSTIKNRKAVKPLKEISDSLEFI